MRRLSALFIVSLLVLGAFTPLAAYTIVAIGRSPDIPVPDGAPQQPDENAIVSVTFPAGSILIPMDTHQAELIKSFGFIHALLRNGTIINRIIEPLPIPPCPDENITIKTIKYPSGDSFSGGPILIMAQYQSIVNAVHSNLTFAPVSLDNTTESFTCDYVFVVKKATKILVIEGQWGKTQNILADMAIPFTLISSIAFKNDPVMAMSYSLIVDDCPGQGAFPSAAIKENLTKFVERGSELIYTDQALGEFKAMPWKDKLGIAYGVNTNQVITANFHAVPDFPGQYSGKSQLKIYQMFNSFLAAAPINSTVKIIADTNTYPASPNYRVLACYFYWGEKNGIVEFFAYHPYEQDFAHTGDADSYRLASFLYGNKFLHYVSSDTSVMTQGSVTPAKIALKGTGPLPGDDQADVALSLKAIGEDVTAGSELKLHYELNPGIDPVAGSFVDDKGSPRAPGITVNGNGSKSLLWNVPEILDGHYWKAFFKITSNNSGKVYLNDLDRCNITYMAGSGLGENRKVEFTTHLQVDVQAGYSKVPESWFFMLSGLSIAGLVIAIRLKMKKGKK